ncbi:diguanylate cyclase [Hoeflea halophila]|uniref:diguanylate cyclase n=1 Tax=Hoeflea halophila TaxID=714899 RepID=A0A286IF31_9HYPH|nr:GGDEF domain-containing protein [Hoeflea halophila]SOE18728.1 diguanylate cyclase [Hoeflea halophila]
MVQSENGDSVDPAMTVVTKMRERGISSLPRNYELVYQFLNSSNTALIREFAALGRRPSQEQLDAIGRKFLPHHHDIRTVDQSRERISGEMRDVINLVKQEQMALRKYSSLLGDTSSRMSENASTPDRLDGLVKVLSSATGDTMKKGDTILVQIVERADEMAQLKSELEEYKRLASIDPVTRLSNRRAFDARLAAIFDDTSNTMHHALLVADIDHFKTFNDTYGHQVGDRVLGAAAAVMKTALNPDAFVARIGGEEFAVVLHGISLEGAKQTAERIRLAIESTPLKNHNDDIDCGRITMSFGLCMATDASSADDLYRKADIALYAAKDAGRNQLKVHIPLLQRLPFLKR